MKKVVWILICIFTMGMLSTAAMNEDIYWANLVEFTIFVDGKEQIFANGPVIISGQTYVPLREFLEGRGFNVQWCAEQQEIHVFTKQMTLSAPIQQAKEEPGRQATEVSFKIFIDGKERVFANKLVVISGRTYVPLKELSEELEFDVLWQEKKKEIYIMTQKEEEEPLFVFDTPEGCGYIDRTGKIILPVSPFLEKGYSEGLCPMWTDGKGWGYVDRTGSYVIEPQFGSVRPFNDGIAMVEYSMRHYEGQKFYTYIDKKGKRIIDREFDLAEDFHEGYGIVMVSGDVLSPWVSPEEPMPKRWTYINKQGELPLERDFLSICDFNEGYSRVMDRTGEDSDWQYALYDHNLNIVIDFGKYSWLGSKVQNGYIEAKNQDGKMGVITPEEEVVMPFIYDSIELIEDSPNLFKVKQNGKWGIVAGNGQTLVDFLYDSLGEYRDYRINAKKGNKWGYINLQGEVITPFQYKEAEPFSEGVAIVKTLDKTGADLCGCINKKGDYVIGLQKEWLETCKNGLIKVSTEDDLYSYYYNRYGEKIEPHE